MAIALSIVVALIHDANPIAAERPVRGFDSVTKIANQRPVVSLRLREHHHTCGHECECRIPAHPQCVACEVDEAPEEKAIIMRYRWHVTHLLKSDLTRLTTWLNEH